MSKKKTLLIGWDAADWKTINPLMDQGLLPSLEKLVNGGTIGTLSTLDPPLSPMLWTSISTGKRPYKHGILNFTELNEKKDSIQLVQVTSRKVKAIWNILSHKGYKCHQIGWWPSHPAEPINGISISNFYQRAHQPITEPWPITEGTVHPKEYESLFAALRLHPQELSGTVLQSFLPDGYLLDQNNKSVQDKIQALAFILADTINIHSAATYILENESWDFLAVYYDGIDHLKHGFMKYHPPMMPHINPEDFERYKHVVTAAYRFFDLMLGRLMELVPEDCQILLISDHGFHSDHLRHKNLPAEPAGAAYEHSPNGILLAKGPNIKKDQMVYGASLLDITPTILAMLDLPVARDMDGKILGTLFEQIPSFSFIDSYENMEGNFFTHDKNKPVQTDLSPETLKHLIELGYIAPVDVRNNQTVEDHINSTKFFEARSYIDGGVYSKAIDLLKELHEQFPFRIHYAQRLANCYIQTEQLTKARKIVQTIRTYQKQDSIALLILQAKVLLLENKPEQALTYVEDAFQLNPDFPNLYLFKGKVERYLKQFDQAEKTLLQAVETDRENYMAYHELGMVALRKKEYESSIHYFLEAVGFQFFLPQTHFHLGKAFEQVANFNSAAQAYQNCLHLQPSHVKARKRLFHIYKNILQKETLAKALKIHLPNEELPEIIIVSGLPRSGTSLMMQMLMAGGIPCFTDGVRSADENNQKGYMEHERIKYLKNNPDILTQVGNRCVKVVAPLLSHLPDTYRYKIIFMQRTLNQIMLSQHKMIERNKGDIKQSFSVRLLEDYQQLTEQIKTTYPSKANFDFLFVTFKDITDYGEVVAIEIEKFLKRNLDTHKMSQVFDPSM